MEKSIISDNLTKDIWEKLDLKEVNPKQLSPLVLAYIGDSIYDLVIKTYIVTEGNTQVNKMNKKASSIVKAETQSRIIGFLEPMLSEEEESIYKRGRNAKSYTSAKNASISDYRRATGFEALMGYLYLDGKYNRMTELIKTGLDFYLEKGEV
ncbi:MAG: ribonuclease III domain-containing protein [Eubacteriales bacterium]|nr:ribonuclease III domain-containing protein [Eubacteriales bacterium]